MAGTPSDDTRSKSQIILEAARNLFVKQGYDKTTIAEIAEEARMAVGTIYLYFRNKHDIYCSVSALVMGKIAEALSNPDLLKLPVREIPRVMIEETFHISRQNIELMSLYHVELRTPEELQQNQQAKEQITNALKAFFEYTIAQGQLAPFNTAMYAKILFTLVDGILHQCFAVERGEHEEMYRQNVTELIERLFFGPSIQAGKTDPN